MGMKHLSDVFCPRINDIFAAVPAERGYSVIEIEVLAIQYAIEDCQFYLLGNKFAVFIDHRPLEGTFQKNLSEVMNPRLLSYRLKLVQYTDMEVVWTKGKSHLIADTF
jgi:hypothetical protein